MAGLRRSIETGTLSAFEQDFARQQAEGDIASLNGAASTSEETE
jgi:hypothetical protein